MCRKHACCAEGCSRRCVRASSLPIEPIRRPTGRPLERFGRIGRCPAPRRRQTGDLCAAGQADTCTNDASCPTGQRCCSNGCTRACSNVIRTPVRRPTFRRVKPGQCPPQTPNVGGPCVATQNSCINDVSCPRNQKCCPGACNSQCVDPVRPPPPVRRNKPGQCPPPTPGLVGACVVDPNSCGQQNGDSSCPGNQKCCPSACNTGCIAPVLTQAEGEDYALTDEFFAVGDFPLDESFAVADPNSGILPETQSDPSNMPVWAICLFVVFAIIFIGLVVVLVQLFVLQKRQ